MTTNPKGYRPKDKNPKYPFAQEVLNAQMSARGKIERLYAYFNDLPADLSVPEVR